MKKYYLATYEHTSKGVLLEQDLEELPPNGKWLTREDLERIYFDAQRTDIYTQIEKEFGKES